MSHRLSVMIATLLYLFEVVASCNAQYPADSVVKIFLTTIQNKGASGTGAIISADGFVLTCYHVIKDAKDIKIILNNKQLYNDVTIIKILPAYDLALLQVRSLPPLRPVILARNNDPSSYLLPLDTYAFPAKTGLFGGMHLKADLSRATWLPSRELRDSDGRALFDFRKPSIDLIAFTMVIDNGDSGAPLLSRQGIVGVISGSFQEGGSISWAIPVKYYDDLNESQAVNKRPKDITSWPEVEPMSSAWRPLRSEVSLTLPLTAALDKYAETLDGLRRVCSSEVLKVPQLKGILQDDIRKADAVIASDGPNTPVIIFGDIWQTLSEIQIIQTLESFGHCRDLYVQIRADGEVLKDQVSSYYANIEHSEINEGLIKVTRVSVDKIDELTHKLDPDTAGDWSPYILGPDSSIKDYRAAFQKGIEVIDRTDPSKGVPTLIEAFTGFDDIVEALLQSQPQRHPKPVDP
jgi:Trypsin-like peptidase domain